VHGLARGIGGGRGAHGKENPRQIYAAGLRARPALLVRGSSRRVTIMRCRPANLRVINRRDSRLGHHRRCVPGISQDAHRKSVLIWRTSWLDRVVPYQICRRVASGVDVTRRVHIVVTRGRGERIRAVLVAGISGSTEGDAAEQAAHPNSCPRRRPASAVRRRSVGQTEHLQRAGALRPVYAIP